MEIIPCCWKHHGKHQDNVSPFVTCKKKKCEMNPRALPLWAKNAHNNKMHNIQVHVIQRQKFLYSHREYSPRKLTERLIKKSSLFYITISVLRSLFSQNEKFFSVFSACVFFFIYVTKVTHQVDIGKLGTAFSTQIDFSINLITSTTWPTFNHFIIQRTLYTY